MKVNQKLSLILLILVGIIGIMPCNLFASDIKATHKQNISVIPVSASKINTAANANNKSITSIIEVLKDPTQRNHLIKLLEKYNDDEKLDNTKATHPKKKNFNFTHIADLKLKQFSYSLTAKVESFKNQIANYNPDIKGTLHSLKKILSYTGFVKYFTNNMASVFIIICGLIIIFFTTYFIEIKTINKLKKRSHNLQIEVKNTVKHLTQDLVISIIPFVISIFFILFFLFIVYLIHNFLGDKYIHQYSLIIKMLTSIMIIKAAYLTTKAIISSAAKVINEKLKLISSYIVWLVTLGALYFFMHWFFADTLYIVISKILTVSMVLIFILLIFKFKKSIKHSLVKFFQYRNSSTIDKAVNYVVSKFYYIFTFYIFIYFVSLILGNYNFLTYILLSTMSTLTILIIYFLIITYTSKYVSNYLIYDFDKLSKNLNMHSDANRKFIHQNMVSSNKIGLFLEKIYYILFQIVTAFAILLVWKLKMYYVVNLVISIPIIFSLLKIIIGLITLLIVSIVISGIIKHKIIKLEAQKEYLMVNKWVTVISLFKKVYIIICIIIMSIVSLSAFGISLTALLASTGALTLVLGFGARDIIRNFLGGLIHIIEDTFSINDWIAVGTHEGTVEGITAFYIKLRDIQGKLHIIPFSEVVSIINETKFFSYAYTVVSISYNQSLDKAIYLLYKSKEDLDITSMKKLIKGPLEITTMYSLINRRVDIRCKIKTVPGEQWDVRNLFLQIVKKQFALNNISIYYPYTEVSLQGVDTNNINRKIIND